MRRSGIFLFSILLFQLWVSVTGFGQTLTEQLLREDSAKLAEQARREGDIIRGAILFHQGNTNCAKCHRPQAETERIGPDLSKLGAEVTDQYLIEAILQPSKVIKQGYETVSIVDLDGKVFNGLLVRQDEQQVVIRDRQNVDKVIAIARDDIEDMQPSAKSSMPDGLADQLKNRKQFLDLLRYVIDVKQRGPDGKVATEQSQRQLEPRLQGLVAVQKNGCQTCHVSTSLPQTIAAKQSPNLRWSIEHLNPDYIETFIADPHGTKPGTTMPQAFGDLDEAARQNAAGAITAYLLSLSERTEMVLEGVEDAEAKQRGRDLFHSIGCVACHATRDAQAVEHPASSASVDSIALGPLNSKYNVAGLVSFLENPLAVRPSGHMPNMKLTRRESTDIASYLLQGIEGQSSWQSPDSQQVDEGQRLFARYRCATCHTGMMDPVVETNLSLEKLTPQKGCISQETGDWPQFALTDSELTAIQSLLTDFPQTLTANQQIDVALTTLNCVACHDRDHLGGVSIERNPHFQTTNLNLGDQGRIPPTLTGVGAKLKPNWMRDVMVNGRSIRPYMQTRMPQFGEQNTAHLRELFAETDKLAKVAYATFEDQKETRKWGLQLAGNEGLNCVACHTYKYKLSDTMPAVDLTEMAERLHKDWFYQYMLDPQTFSPNTVMPSFWPAGKAIRNDLQGTPEDQVEALWQYLIDGRQAGTPRGVVREPLEVVVKDEAQLLRRKYPTIGKRGIGVGYPGGLNLAYDAEQMRLGLLWKGKFADPAGVWTGQGSGDVRPMGRTIEFPKGPELDYQNDVWVVDDGRPPNHRFQGYRLDKKMRPTFRYQLGDIQVTDFFEEMISEDPSKSKLQRTITLLSDAPHDPLRFRVASAEKIESLESGGYSVGDRLQVTIVSEQTAELSQQDGQLLQIVMEGQPGKLQTLQINYLWDR